MKHNRYRNHKNPLIQQKYDEGYELGKQHAMNHTKDYFKERLMKLEDIKGIGPKRAKTIILHFRDYRSINKK